MVMETPEEEQDYNKHYCATYGSNREQGEAKHKHFAIR